MQLEVVIHIQKMMNPYDPSYKFKQRFNSSTISIYQEEHLTYGIIDQSDLRFVIPNSVYNNVKSYCKK